MAINHKTIWLQEAGREIVDKQHYTLVLQLTAIFFISKGLGPYRPAYWDAPVVVLCIMFLLNKRFLTSRALWFLIFLYVMALNFVYFELSANHFYLIAYWSLACALALGTQNQDIDTVLRQNARMLLGLGFCFAALWKIMAGEYINGSFFHYSFLTRFIDSDSVPLITWILSPVELAENIRLKQMLQHLPVNNGSIALTTSNSIRYFSHLLSLWTLLIEAVIGVAFLFNRPKFIVRKRDYLLMLFILTTFIIIPIDRFALILMLLGLAQCPQERRRLKFAYLTIFIVMQFVVFVDPVTNHFEQMFR